MSYDYNALVRQIAQERRLAAAAGNQASDDDGTNHPSSSQLQLEHLTNALEAFETLSSHCPMTPLLWIQNAETASQLMVLCATSGGGDDDAAKRMEQDITDNKDDNQHEYQIAALQTRLDILELGLQEFPGSAMLHSYRAEYMVHSHNSLATIASAIETALHQVGQGSHLKEDDIVARLFDMHLNLALQPQQSLASVIESLLWRSRVPLQQNESLEQMARQVLSSKITANDPQHHDIDTVLATIAKNRQRVAKAYSELYSHGDDIEMSLHQLGILAKHQLPLSPLDSGDSCCHTNNYRRINWSRVAESTDDQPYGMGLGDRTVAHAFIQYALAVQAAIQRETERRGTSAMNDSNNTDDDDDDDDFIIPTDLPTAIYERAMAECPTVESLWLSYIRHVTERLQQLAKDSLLTEQVTPMASKLQSMIHRASRNCPDSLQIVEQKLSLCLALSKYGCEVVDPDAILETAQKALDSKFLPADWQHLRVYLTAIRVVKQRILMLLTPTTHSTGGGAPIEYDDVEPMPKMKKRIAHTLSDSDLEEVHDLMDDVADMYQQAENRLKKAFPKWSAGRSSLWRDQALTSLFLLDDLGRMGSSGQQKHDAISDKTAVFCFEKALRISNPSHPDAYRSYITAFAVDSATLSTECDVARRIRQVRGLYQQAIKSIGRPNSSDRIATDTLDDPLQRGFDSAFGSLCQEWLEFENTVGSDRSVGRATRAIQNKVRKIQHDALPVATLWAHHPGTSENSALTTKRKPDESFADDVEEKLQPASKKTKLDDDARTDVDTMGDGDGEGFAQVTQADIAKVKVGNLEYPAHPYTVRISFLNPESEEMDLVELLRPKCGCIVHARIIRERHPPYKSKGWALVQFEEKESVEKALALDDVVGLHSKVLRIERSHQPAVSLVPPGRHKVSEKGHGKHSKRNEKKQENKKTGIGKGQTDIAFLNSARGETDRQSKHVAGSDKQTTQAHESSGTTDISETAKKAEATAAGLLAFRPRKVAGGSRRKPKLILTTK